jgi:hypothetical protein
VSDGKHLNLRASLPVDDQIRIASQKRVPYKYRRYRCGDERMESTVSFSSRTKRTSLPLPRSAYHSVASAASWLASGCSRTGSMAADDTLEPLVDLFPGN